MSVNGANQVITAKFTAIQALEKAGDQKGADALRQQLLDFGFTKDQIDEGILNLAKGPEGTPEQRAARGAANQGAVDEVAQMKAQSQQAPVAGFGQNPTQVAAMHQGLKAEAEQPKLTPEQQAANNEAFVTRGGHRATLEELAEQYEKIDTKEEQKALGIEKTFDKDVRKNLKSVRKQMALDTIYTDKAAYEAKVDELKAQGKWDKKNPSVTYMKPGALEAAKKLDESLRKQGISMFNADGSINKEVSQTVAQLIAGYGGDRADLNETKALAKELGVKEGDIKDFVRANNVDAQKNKKLVSILTGIGAGVGAFFAGPITNILGLGLATKEIVTNTINNNSTVDNNTTITNNNDIRVDEDGSTHIHNDSFTTGSSTTTNTSSTTSTTSGTGKKSRWNAKQIIGDLIGAGVVGLGVGKLMVSLLNHDSNILKDGKQIDALLKDEKSVKGKKNQEIVKRLIMADAPDEVKLNALIDAFGNAKGGKLNTRELVGALGQVMAYKKPEPPKPPVPPTPPPEPPKPTTTEVEVWDINGDNFVDDHGQSVTVNGRNARGSVGHARDHELLRKRNAPTESNDPTAKAQYVIADERGEIRVTPSVVDGKNNYDEPEEITMSDNTNGKVNTYTYRKLTQAEIDSGKAADGTALTGLQGRKGPFYVLTSATDPKGNLKTNHTEVFQLELIPEEEVVEEKDEKGNVKRTKIKRNNYKLEQYQGMNGSGRTSMIWNNRARRR